MKLSLPLRSFLERAINTTFSPLGEIIPSANEGGKMLQKAKGTFSLRTLQELVHNEI